MLLNILFKHLKGWRKSNMIKRNEAKILVPIISAYAEGRILQYKEKEEWRDIEDSEGLSINTIIKEAENYRIKPKPKYRPFANAEECWNEMKKHQPFGFMKFKHTESGYYMLTSIARGVGVGINDSLFSYDRVFDDYSFADGTPFGVKEEE